MLKLRNVKILAILASMGVLFVLGATHTASLASKGTEMNFGADVCSGPSKVFNFGLAQQASGSVSALMMRIAPEVALSQMIFEPQPEEIFRNRNGLLELRYAHGTTTARDALQVEVCGANVTHEVREAYWIVRANEQPLAQMINTDNITWELKDSGENLVPGTQLETKELSCAGMPIVQTYQFVVQNQPLCIVDPEGLEQIQEEMDRVAKAQSSFIGKVKQLFFGSTTHEKQLAELNRKMEQLYLYSPYEGVVQGIAKDTINGLAWIEMEVEASAQNNNNVLTVD